MTIQENNLFPRAIILLTLHLRGQCKRVDYTQRQDVVSLA